MHLRDVLPTKRIHRYVNPILYLWFALPTLRVSIPTRLSLRVIESFAENTKPPHVLALMHGRPSAQDRTVLAQARRELEQTRNDRSGIEAATDKLNAAKSDTKRLDAAKEQAEKALPAPSEATAE